MDERTEQPISVWRYDDAPKWMRDLSPHGGDEDWIAHVPACHRPEDDAIRWLDSGTAFGVCDVSRHPQSDGSCIYIGAHA